MLRNFSTAGRLIAAIGVAIVATLVVVPLAVRARQRVPHHDLGQHDPIPPRLRLNWNGEVPAAKAKAAPPDGRQLSSPPPGRAVLPVAPGRPERFRVRDERIPTVRPDRSPLVFRGPPTVTLS